MTRGRTQAPVRPPDESPRVSLLELFFDLVYVAALALASMSFARDVSWIGALHILLPLMALWWLWSITTLLTDFYDAERPSIQALIIAIMVGSMVMATTLPQAFGDRGRIFAVAYVTVHLGRGVWLVVILRRHEAQARAARFLFWYAISGVPWIVGALLPGTSARLLLWGLALAVEYVAGGFRYPTPRIGRIPIEQYRRAQEHAGERYQQFMILALGDLVLVAVLRYDRTGLGAGHTLAALATFMVTVLLWQIYVSRAGSLLRGLPPGKPARTLRWAPYTHLVMIYGIVVTAGGLDRVIQRPFGVMPPSWVAAVFGGSALFLVGRSVFEYEVFGRISWSRLAWLVVLLAVSPAMTLINPATAAVVDVAVLLGVAISDAIRGRRDTARAAGAQRAGAPRPG